MWRNSARYQVIIIICIPFAGRRTWTVLWPVISMKSLPVWVVVKVRCLETLSMAGFLHDTVLLSPALNTMLSSVFTHGATTAVHGRTSLPECRCTGPFTLYGCLIMRVGHGRLYFVKGVISVFSKVMDRASRLELGWVGALECWLQIEEVGRAWFYVRTESVDLAL